MPSALKSHRSQGIDALRAIAALMVVFYHLYVPLVGIPFYDSFLRFFHKYGPLGVDLFFVLSGFCIHWGYSKPGAFFSVKNYARRRWWRIYPPYFFALSLAVILNLSGFVSKWKTGANVSMANFGADQILGHVFLVHNFFDRMIFAINPPFWTIAIEAQFYLFYIFAKPMFYDKKGWLGILFLGAVLHVVAWHFHGQGSPFKYWIEWLMGACAAYLLRARPLLTKPWFLYLVLFLACCWGANAFMQRDMERYSRPLFALAFVFLLLIFLRGEKIWSWPIFKRLPFLGNFSYSIYLVHYPLADRLRPYLISAAGQGWPRFTASIVSIFICLGASYLFFLGFEEPFLARAAQILN